MLARSHTTPTLSEKSLDFKLFCGFHLCMLIAFGAHFLFKLDIAGEAALAVAAAGGAILFSIWKRAKCGWHWPGTQFRDVVWAFAAALLIAFFAAAAVPGRSPLNPNLFPWCASGIIMLAFAVLSGLRVVCQSEREFQDQCGAGPRENRPPPTPGPRPWRKVVVNAFQIYFLVVWIIAVAFFWKLDAAFRHGSPVATPTQTTLLSNRGSMVYIAPREDHSIHQLEWAVTLGIPSVLVIGAFLHFVAGVKILSPSAGEPRAVPSRHNL